MIEHLHRIAAHAYYADEHDAGRRACDRLLRLSLSPEKEQRVRSNRTWYTQTLEHQGIRCEFSRIEIPTRPGWSLFNPSIVRHGDRTIVNVRSSNYRIDENGRYVIPPEDGDRIRTTNYLVFPDGCREPSEWHAADYAFSDFSVEGLEDVRLNSVDGQLVASATCRNWHGHDGTCRIAVGEIERIDRISNLRCHHTVPGRHEKNWMPITGRRDFLYHCHHQGRTCLVREDGDDWTVTSYAESPLVARGFRGGTQLILWNRNTWLACVHEVSDIPKRVYEHRFVMFDESHDWRITKVSPPFAFRETRSIEFAAGMTWISGQGIHVTFGSRDAEAWRVQIPAEQLADIMVDAWD